MKCFICAEKESIKYFYCKLCKKTELCHNCWTTWLNSKFTCPFDKNDVFILEVTKENSSCFLDFDRDYHFKQFYNIYYTPKFTKFKDYTKYDLSLVLVYYIPFYNEMFSEDEFSYHYFVKAFKGMGILNTFYDKWIFTLMLSQILYGHKFEVHESDVAHFGGVSFINLINKLFGNRIIITKDSCTQITFYSSLWCPKYQNCYNFETNIMIYLYEFAKLDYDDFNSFILEEKEFDLGFEKHDLMIDVFRIYWKIKLENGYEIKKDEVPECLWNNKYFTFYFTLLNNSFFI